MSKRALGWMPTSRSSFDVEHLEAELDALRRDLYQSMGWQKSPFRDQTSNRVQQPNSFIARPLGGRVNNTYALLRAQQSSGYTTKNSSYSLET